MADVKIQELTNETNLTDDHLLITQENSDTAETKKTTLGLLKSFLNMLDFSDISQYFVEGTNVNISIDNDTQKITISASTTGEKGDKGDDGFSPIATVEQTETGAVISITDSNGTTTANLINGSDGANGTNGITPHIDETTKHWFVGEEDTGIIAEGITTVSTTSVEYTGLLTAIDWVGDTAPYTQTVDIIGITSNISPIVDLVVSDDITTGKEEISQWACITKAVTDENVIVFSCYKDKPTIDLNIKVKVV